MVSKENVGLDVGTFIGTVLAESHVEKAALLKQWYVVELRLKPSLFKPVHVHPTKDTATDTRVTLCSSPMQSTKCRMPLGTLGIVA